MSVYTEGIAFADELDRVGAAIQDDTDYLCSRQMPKRAPFVVVISDDISAEPTMHVTDPTNKSKLLEELHIEGSVDDPWYAMVSPALGVSSHNDERLLKVAQERAQQIMATEPHLLSQEG